MELEAQPDQRIEYTDKLEMDRIINRPKLKFSSGFGIGRGVQISSANNSARVGMRINSVVEEVVGCRGSFKNNFTPSAIGWSKP